MRGTILRRIAIYGLAFWLFAAPMEFHFNWGLLVVEGSSVYDSILVAMDSGILFFVTLTIVIEALFRLEASPDLNNRPDVFCAKLMCIALGFAFLFVFYALDELRDNGYLAATQLVGLVIAIFPAMIIHFQSSVYDQIK